MRQRPAAFPVGLYGLLLFALCWLTLPSVFAPLEPLLVGATCLSVRVVSGFVGEPVRAGSAAPADALAAPLAERIRAHAAPARAPWLADSSPVHCAVVAVGKTRGGGGEACELLLDHTYAELAGCRELVTKGDAFVGLLQAAGVGVAAGDCAGDFARVVLPNHARARAVHAECAVPDGAPLRFVVRAAATVDPAPLRVDLWDDPWRASRLDRPGLPVWTRAVLGTSSPVPAGLLLGTTRIWGYPAVGDGGDVTLGVFVVPAVAPRALSHVVVWRAAAAAPARLDGPPAAPARAVTRAPGALHELPGAAHGRLLLVGPPGLADGAAVLHDGRFVGTARRLHFGSALVTAFASSRQRWNLLALPDASESPPLEFAGEVLAAEGNTVVLAPVGESPFRDGVRPGPGWLFTGSNGLLCPAGLCIGHFVPHPRTAGQLLLTVPVVSGPLAVEVLVPEGRP